MVRLDGLSLLDLLGKEPRLVERVEVSTQPLPHGAVLGRSCWLGTRVLPLAGPGAACMMRRHPVVPSRQPQGKPKAKHEQVPSRWIRLILLVTGIASALAVHAAPSCEAMPQSEVGGKGVQAFRLADGGHAAWSAMHINIDGYGRAYHRNGRQAGAVLHLCVGGEVFLPDGTRYHGSTSQATCTGRFMADLARIEDAGWTDPSVGVVRWYGVVAEGQATVAGRTVKGVKPVLQRDGSGFYVSPTSLVDHTVTDLADQRRYVNPLRVAAAVAPGALLRAGVRQGSFGVAIRSDKRIAVPFVVGDTGPRIGEGTPALARRAAGLAPTDEISLANRYAGAVDGKQVLWVFFGGPPAAFNYQKEADLATRAQSAFEAWGGEDRLWRCMEALPRS